MQSKFPWAATLPSLHSDFLVQTPSTNTFPKTQKSMSSLEAILFADKNNKSGTRETGQSVKCFGLQESTEFDFQKPLKQNKTKTRHSGCVLGILVLGGRDRRIPGAHLAHLENSRPNARPCHKQLNKPKQPPQLRWLSPEEQYPRLSSAHTHVPACSHRWTC